MAHVTDLGFTMEDLESAISKGDVRSQTHPDFPELSIYNYGEEAQFKNRWNKITLACRGLILNNVTGEVVARPWEKFFNFGQMDNRIGTHVSTHCAGGGIEEAVQSMRPDLIWLDPADRIM